MLYIEYQYEVQVQMCMHVYVSVCVCVCGNKVSFPNVSCNLSMAKNAVSVSIT